MTFAVYRQAGHFGDVALTVRLQGGDHLDCSAREGRYYFNTYENAAYTTASFKDFNLDGTKVEQVQ